ncbi:MAG TPA: hypothetical protein VIV11_26635, partial [Kofleriaceae bacterium]
PPDAAVAVFVTGCDDPAVWTATALGTAELRPEIGGGPCSPAQYPLHRVVLSWSADGVDLDQHDRTCWRVVDASPGSGWTAGDQFTHVKPGPPPMMYIKGFERPVTVEGRVLRDDGALAFAIAPQTIELAAARIREPNAGAVIAVMSPEAWAEPDAVTVWGTRVVTDEVVGASAVPGGTTAPVTLHRTTDGLVRRTWSRVNNQPVSSDLVLGPGMQARIAAWAAAIVVDREVLVIGQQNAMPFVQKRIPLMTDQFEMVGHVNSVTLHFSGLLANFDYFSNLVRSLGITGGVLLPSDHHSAPFYFDGQTFRQLEISQTEIGFDDVGTFTPDPAQLAAIGAPVAVLHGIVFGELGLLAALDKTSTVPGPRVASYAELFGEGRLGPIATDTAAYVIKHEDGGAVLYEAPYVDFCD